MQPKILGCYNINACIINRIEYKRELLGGITLIMFHGPYDEVYWFNGDLTGKFEKGQKVDINYYDAYVNGTFQKWIYKINLRGTIIYKQKNDDCVCRIL